jgi:flagellar biogenesis protein FliO
MNQEMLISLTFALSGLILVAFALMRYRDRLQRHFNNGPIIVKSHIALNAHAQLYLIEVNQQHYLCGIGREGVNCLTQIAKCVEHASCE